MLGVALDVYHIWWDPELMGQIARAGKDSAARNSMSATGLYRPKTSSTTAAWMGDGVIDVNRNLRAAVEAQGCAGYSESRNLFPTTGGADRWTRVWCAPASNGTRRR